MERATVCSSPLPIIGCTHHDIERKIGHRVAQMSDGPANAGGIHHRGIGDFFDDEQVHIAVRSGFTIGIGTEENDLLRVEPFYENLKVRPQLIGNPVDRVVGITENFLTNSRQMDRRNAHGGKIAWWQEMSSLGGAMLMR